MISSAWWFTPSILLKQKGLYKTKERHLVVGEYYYSLEELIYILFLFNIQYVATSMSSFW